MPPPTQRGTKHVREASERTWAGGEGSALSVIVLVIFRIAEEISGSRRTRGIVLQFKSLWRMCVLRPFAMESSWSGSHVWRLLRINVHVCPNLCSTVRPAREASDVRPGRCASSCMFIQMCVVSGRASAGAQGTRAAGFRAQKPLWHGL
eukprot:scaffold138561_cov33-Tisochrysis_lutea.AAC.3